MPQKIAHSGSAVDIFEDELAVRTYDISSKSPESMKTRNL